MVVNRQTGILFLLMLVISVLTLPDEAAAKIASCRDTTHVLQGLVGDLRASRGKLHAFDVGKQLPRIAGNAPRRCMRFIVPLFVDLLHDDDDLARLYAAAALGDIGAPARSAVPTLMEALKRDKCVCDGSMCMKPSWSSTIAIEFAMMEITGASGDPALYNCGYSGSVPMRPNPPSSHPPS